MLPDFELDFLEAFQQTFPEILLYSQNKEENDQLLLSLI